MLRWSAPVGCLEFQAENAKNLCYCLTKGCILWIVVLSECNLTFEYHSSQFWLFAVQVMLIWCFMGLLKTIAAILMRRLSKHKWKYLGGCTLPDAGPWGHRRWPCWYQPPFPVTWALPPCRQRRMPPKRHNPTKSSLFAICAWATLVPGSWAIPPNVSAVRPVSSGPNSSCSPGTLSVCTGGHPFFLFRLKIRSHVTLYTRHHLDYYYNERPFWFFFRSRLTDARRCGWQK